MVYLLKMVIFHSYDSLPEGICSIIRENMWNQRRLRLKRFRFCGFLGIIQNPNTAILRESSRMAMEKYKPSLPKQISKMVPDPPSPPMSLGVLAEFKPTSLRDGTLIFLESVAIRNGPSWNKWDRNHHKSSQTVGLWHWGYYEHPWK